MHFKARWHQNKHGDGPLHHLPFEVQKRPRKILRKSILHRAHHDRTSCINILRRVLLTAIDLRSRM